MKKPNIVIIVLDSLRLDVFKELDKKRSLAGFQRLEECIAPAPWTLPSHASLFTGMYPSEHGAHETKEVKSLNIEKIKLRKKTFIDDLNRLGYHTYAVSANPYVHPIYGFNDFREFIEETYFTDILGYTIEVPKKLKPLFAKYRERYGGNFFKIGFAMLRDDPKLITKTIYLPETGLLTLKNISKKIKAKLIDGWPLEKGGKNIVKRVREMDLREPFMLFINMMEPHDPYVGVKKDVDWSTSFMKSQPSEKDVIHWKRLYYKASAKALQYADAIVSNLADRYGENQIMIVTSDHGQEFNEHGFIGHGVMLHDEIVKIPFALKMPKGFKQRGRGRNLSLVNVKNFIAEALKGNKNAVEELYSGRIYSESFGIPANISIMKGIDKEKIRRNEKYRIRIFE
ncbi:MAG: sulfatase-like hydrolase/transferase [Candidatus Micrarchaeia archaeon]